MTNTETHPDFQAIIEKIAELSPDGYYKFVFCHPFDFYRRRVRMIGAHGYDRVLDAGHGFGQWTIALAEINGHVCGIDRNEPRYKISQLLTSHYKQDNVDLRLLDVADIPNEFEPGEFDLVWSWSTIQFMDRSTAMTAFNKALKKNGQLVLGGVNTSTKWLCKYFHGWRQGIKNRSYYRACYKGFRGAHDEHGANAINFSTAAKTAEKYGFEVEAIAYDGELRETGDDPLYFEKTMLKQFQNIEMRLIKIRDL